MFKEILSKSYELLYSLITYIKSNSIDFIGMIASIFIALKTDKLIEKRKEKSTKKEIIELIIKELESIQTKIELDINKSDLQFESGKLDLQLSPYNYSYWDNIRNTEKIEIFSECRGYNETITFYSNIEKLNMWEDLQTKYILFSQQEKQEFRDSIVIQLVTHRKQCLILLKKALEEIRKEKV